MADGTYQKFTVPQNGNKPAQARQLPEISEEQYRRQVREWTEKLSCQPGWKGKLLRRAFTQGWC